MKKIITLLVALAFFNVFIGCDESDDNEARPTGELETGELPGFGTYKISAEVITSNGEDLYCLGVTVLNEDKTEGYGVIFTDADGLRNCVLMAVCNDSSKRVLYDDIAIYTNENAVVQSYVYRGSTKYNEADAMYEFTGEWTCREASKKQLQSAATLNVVLSRNNTAAAQFSLPLSIRKYMKYVIL